MTFSVPAPRARSNLWIRARELRPTTSLQLLEGLRNGAAVGVWCLGKTQEGLPSSPLGVVIWMAQPPLPPETVVLGYVPVGGVDIQKTQSEIQLVVQTGDAGQGNLGPYAIGEQRQCRDGRTASLGYENIGLGQQDIVGDGSVRRFQHVRCGNRGWRYERSAQPHHRRMANSGSGVIDASHRCSIAWVLSLP